MTKILTARQTQELDRYTIEQEPIASIDLMERAARAFVRWFRRHYPDDTRLVQVFCGPGNNGGDGFAVARLLHDAGYRVSVYACRIGQSQSPDCAINEQRLQDKRVIPVQDIFKDAPWPTLPTGQLIIDGLFGSGLNRPLAGYWGALVEFLNGQRAERIAIDIPSGLFADATTQGIVFRAGRTVSFQLPKLAFLMAENARHVGRWTVVDIGLHPEGLARQDTPYHHLTGEQVARWWRPRQRFDHKGTFGHALIIAGSYGKVGAAILSARAALRAGCGLVTVQVPQCGYAILQIAFPEAMVRVDSHQQIWTVTEDTAPFQAVGVGPGIGTNLLTARALSSLLEEAAAPLILDADALNILGQHPEWQEKLPPGSILTPHPKEFERLFGPTENDFDRLQLLRERAQALRCYIVLKGGYTAIATPEGVVYFNTNGNPGMGTAGAGDVLTGILAGLLAQGYAPLVTCCLGVWLHGQAGDLAARELEQESLLAEDIISQLGPAFKTLKSSMT